MSRTRIDPSLLNNLSSNLNMGSNKINSLANGTASTDAATYGQLGGVSFPYARGVIISNITTTQNHLLWDDVILEDMSGNKIRNSVPNTLVTLNISTSGVNGLDTGSVAASTFYFIWIISDGTNFKGLYSLSNSSPTMPGGYIYKIPVGCILTDGSANIIPSSQIGKRVQYFTNIQVVSDSSNNNSAQTATATSAIPSGTGSKGPSWLADINVLLTGSYSSAAFKEILFETGLTNTTVTTIIFDNVTYLSTGFQINYETTVPMYSEPTPTFGWLASYATSGLTSFHTFIYVKGYYLTEFALI